MKRQEIILSGEPQRQHLIRFLSAVKLEKPIKVTIEEHRKTRTLNQNALMWKWLTEVAELVSDYSGHTPEEVHEFMKARFLPEKLVEIGGETMSYRTTTKLTTEEMSAYMDRIYEFVTRELGLFLTLPEERLAR